MLVMMQIFIITDDEILKKILCRNWGFNFYFCSSIEKIIIGLWKLLIGLIKFNNSIENWIIPINMSYVHVLLLLLYYSEKKLKRKNPKFYVFYLTFPRGKTKITILFSNFIQKLYNFSIILVCVEIVAVKDWIGFKNINTFHLESFLTRKKW